ncbi:5-exo-alcohol dehydrogenase [Actinokineospora fastidiosa]|uniref:5-exo-alcohol dehydrogenase n=1 Tax=Actinokineospora fastidiosa TaxID=1816 RepID=A0A918GN23_9PSEU|nr:5-exo-alcohol dehydrogenase [Actinokineospora fastidiosa]
MARAVVLSGFGSPLEIRDVPVPSAPEGGLVVAPAYAGICGTDLHLREGRLAVPLPLVLGHEGLGTVHESRMEGFAEGDVVMWASSRACGRCEPCTRFREPTLCENRRTYGVNRPGAWADHIRLEPGTTVIRMPDGVDPVAAMSLACAGPTMVHALSERRPVRVGESVIVQGAGPVGLAAAALAQLGGARVTIVGGPPERLALARELGIGDDWADIGADVPEADLVIECAGVPAAVGQGLRMARRGGAYLVVGQYTDAGDTLINPHQIVHRQLSVFGSWAFSGAHLVEYVRLLPALTARFDLARLVTAYPLDDHQRALDDVAAGRVLKAVLTP